MQTETFSELTKATVSKWGNSLGIRLPVKITKELMISEGDELLIGTIDNKIVLQKKPIRETKSLREKMEAFYGIPYDDIPIIHSEEIRCGKSKGEEI